MSEEKEEKKHVTAATTDQPQEEFIEEKARPSRDEHAVPQESPPKGASEK